jgi:F-type H+-transporting ATPase subunit alpha
VCARFQTAAKLSDADRTAIIEIARQALAPFQPKPAAKSEPDKKVDEKPGPAAKTGGKAEPKSDKSTPASASKPEQKAGPEPAEGTKADAATKPKLESEAGPKPDGGASPKASTAAKTDPAPKPEVKVKES